MSSRRQFTFEEKVATICRLENGDSNSVIAKEINAKPLSISTIWKNRDKIKENVSSKTPSGKRFRAANYPELDAAVFKWFQQHHSLIATCYNAN